MNTSYRFAISSMGSPTVYINRHPITDISCYFLHNKNENNTLGLQNEKRNAK